jgi:hypothetical protein
MVRIIPPFHCRKIETCAARRGGALTNLSRRWPAVQPDLHPRAFRLRMSHRAPRPDSQRGTHPSRPPDPLQHSCLLQPQQRARRVGHAMSPGPNRDTHLGLASCVGARSVACHEARSFYLGNTTFRSFGATLGRARNRHTIHRLVPMCPNLSEHPPSIRPLPTALHHKCHSL